MSLAFYQIFLLIYKTGMVVTSLFNKKAAAWLSGRRGIFNKLQHFKQNCGHREIIWMHCASLGEFEQGRPVLEKLKELYPEKAYLLTFFSPSGYEIRKNYKGADGVFYLPMDGYINANRFVALIQPTLVIWVKYEYWFYYLQTLSKKEIPVLLISAVFRNSQQFFKGTGGLWRRMLGFFTIIFTQNQLSESMLRHIKVNNVIVGGDTRFDRVVQIAGQPASLPHSIIDFCGNKPVIVCGSTWEEDELMWKHYIQTHPGIRFIFAPHHVDKDNILNIRKYYPKSLVFSEHRKEFNADENLLVVDTIGMLASLYRLATVTYVGGGFNESGIHNTLEAAVYGRPVIFGPNYEKFAEAKGLVEAGAAFTYSTPVELENMLDLLLNNTELLAKASMAAKNFVNENTGATDRIIKYIQEKRLLT